MLRTRDDASDMLSLYSQPQTMTRASTGTDTTYPLPTPMDEMPSSRPSKVGILGPRTMDSGKFSQDAIPIRSGSPNIAQPHNTHKHVGTVPESREVDPEPYGPYFSLPRDVTADRPALHHQRSTKLLISRYESMESSAASSRASSRASTVLSTRRVQQPPPLSGKKDKGHSPIRRSFRNFLSVFKKGRGMSKDDDSAIPSTRYITGVAPDTSQNHSHPPPVNHFTLSTKDPAADDVMPASSPTPSPLFSGPLLYLSRSSAPPTASPMLPVWTTCTVTLQRDHILITWLSTHGNPSTHHISLEACADVRSLALTQIDSNERALLPRKGDAGELKVFEIQFEGKPREKFAATSVQERAGWVSAIWDVILQSPDRQDADVIEPRALKQLTVTADCTSTSRTDIQSIHSTSSAIETVNTSSSARGSSYSERALPPTPKPAQSQEAPPPLQRISLHDPPRARSLASPMLSRSSLAEPLSPISLVSRSKSPSIVNLGSRSVVKQRLAQIEHTYSNPSSAETSSSSRLYRRTTGLNAKPSGSSRSERLRTAFLDIERLHREGSFRTDRGDSFQGDISSPVSACTDNSGFTTPRTNFSRMNRTTPNRPPPSDQSWVLSGTYSTPMERAEAPTSYCVPHADIGPDLSVVETPEDNSRQHLQHLAHLENRFMHPEQVSRQAAPPVVSIVGHNCAPTGNVFGALEVIGEGIDEIAGQNEEAEAELKRIREKLEEIVNGAGRPTVSDPEVVKTLQDVRSQLNFHLPTILQRLEEIRCHPEPTSSANAMSARFMNNLQPVPPLVDGPKVGPMVDKLSPLHLLEVHQKLDGLMSLCQRDEPAMQIPSCTADGAPPHISDELTNKLQEILTLLNSHETHRQSQAEQQVDSVRYLNELNSWLETFVNNGTSQIQVVSAGVQKLCKELGCEPETQEASGEEPNEDGGHTLLENIRQLVADGRDRDQRYATLKGSVDGLVDAVNEDLRQTVEARNAFTTESVIGLIDRQRQDQENMLRALATELSNDIRGERLRFVDAMKEATAINVQVHVEQFKKELTREVLLMTQEVGRLHRERQAMEQQIADLFAFYSKQKQATIPTSNRVQGHTAVPDQGPPQTLNTPHFRSSSTRRPLPNPLHGRR